MINRHCGSGWEYLHVAVDDRPRLAYTEILPDERKASAIAFLERAPAWFARHGITVERIMTDNGSAYRSHSFRHACTCAGVTRHLRTRPYTPRTNGKAERFPQTVMRECAYARAWSSRERAAALPLAARLQRPPAADTALAGQPSAACHEQPPVTTPSPNRILAEVGKPGRSRFKPAADPRSTECSRAERRWLPPIGFRIRRAGAAVLDTRGPGARSGHSWERRSCRIRARAGRARSAYWGLARRHCPVTTSSGSSSASCTTELAALSQSIV